MFSIAIYSQEKEQIEIMRSYIQDFLIDIKMLAKVSVFSDAEEFLTVPNRYDIYVMDMDAKEDIVTLSQQMMSIDTGSRYIFISAYRDLAYEAAKAQVDYFFLKPLDKDEFLMALQRIKQQIQWDNIIIKTPDGERRLRVNHLNYINIIKRCLCYHLVDGNMFDGQTLRTSFEKAIHPLEEHKAFLFLPPSLLINIGEVKEVRNDHVIFENDEVLYFPKKSYDLVRNTWLNYTRIL